MTHIQRKKNTRQRGSHTHGGGSKKKRRGAGNRGGRGNAGSGKKGDAKKPSYWKDTKYFGKYGFTSIHARKIKTISIIHLDTVVDNWADQGLAQKKKDVYSINLKELGYHKLLGTGNTSKKMELTVEDASAAAKQKIEAAGGKLQLLPSPRKKKQEKEEKEKEEKEKGVGSAQSADSKKAPAAKNNRL